jgi:hypothetical protein
MPSGLSGLEHMVEDEGEGEGGVMEASESLGGTGWANRMVRKSARLDTVRPRVLMAGGPR